MKTNLLLRILFLASLFLSQFTIQAQPTTWAQPGAHWYYTIGDSVPIGYYGYFELWEDGDTLFSNGIICDILRTHERGITFWSGGAIFDNEGPTIYTYQSNDTVYYYYDNQFNILFVNSIQPGQNWVTGTDILTFCDGDTIFIDSVMSVNLNGTIMNRIVPNFPGWGMMDPTIYFHSPIYERFGSTGFFLPAPMCVTDISYGPLRCYSDSSGFSYTPAALPTCDYITGLDDVLPDPPSYLTILPNPVKDILIIQFENKYISAGDEFELYSVSGEKLQTYKIKNKEEQISVSHLAAGTYFIKIKNRPQVKPVSFIKL